MGESRKFVQWAVLVIAIALIISGVLGNELREVWSKAVLICMECVGIG